MVIAGIKKRKTQGAKRKNEFKSAKPAFKILKLSLKTHKNKPLINKNTPITKYAIGLAKNELNSFLKMANMVDLFIRSVVN
jgi:hypothetical protein